MHCKVEFAVFEHLLTVGWPSLPFHLWPYTPGMAETYNHMNHLLSIKMSSSAAFDLRLGLFCLQGFKV